MTITELLQLFRMVGSHVHLINQKQQLLTKRVQCCLLIDAQRGEKLFLRRKERSVEDL